MALTNRPEVVTLCGSTRFKDDFIELNARWTLAGKIVLTVGWFMHSDGTEPLPRLKKAQVDVLHMAKIDMSSKVIIINRDGYIGESTEREIVYAQMRGVATFYAYFQHPSGTWRQSNWLWNPTMGWDYVDDDQIETFDRHRLR